MGAIPSILRKNLKDLFATIKGKGKASLVILGLDSSGKTTLVNLFKSADEGKSFEAQTNPTLGFNVEKVSFANTDINIWDIGGQNTLIGFWSQYVSDVNGMVFMIDIADEARFKESYDAFSTLVSHLPDRLPILLFLNKRDLLDGNVQVLSERKREIERIYNIDNQTSMSDSYMKAEGKSFKVKVADISVVDDIDIMRNNGSLTSVGVYSGFKWLVDEIKTNK